MFRTCSHRLPLAAIFAAGLITSASGQTLPGNATPPVGSIEMPLVTPQEAARYLAARDVPQAAPVPLPKVDSNASPVKVNVDPVLGHDLPEGDTTGYGFKRADFATSPKGQAEATKKKRQDALGSTATIGTRPATAVIEEQPPLLGNR